MWWNVVFLWLSPDFLNNTTFFHTFNFFDCNENRLWHLRQIIIPNLVFVFEYLQLTKTKFLVPFSSLIFNFHLFLTRCSHLVKWNRVCLGQNYRLTYLFWCCVGYFGWQSNKCNKICFLCDYHLFLSQTTIFHTSFNILTSWLQIKQIWTSVPEFNPWGSVCLRICVANQDQIDRPIFTFNFYDKCHYHPC